MYTALCTIDNNRYDIASFSRLDEQKLTHLRRALVFQECNGKGYYRKKSRDGKSACFGAYHKDNCKLKTQSSALHIIPEMVEEVNTITTNNQIIDIKFDAYEQNINSSDNISNSDINQTSRGRSKQHTVNPAQERHIQRGLKSLLRMLMHTDSFASSDIKINTGAQHPFKAKNLFVHFDLISEEYLHKWRGYWGIVSHADSNLSWLNVANEKDVSIPIANLNDHIRKMRKIESAEDLAGAAVLLFGRLNISDKGKWYIKIDDDNPQHIYIKLAK